MGEVRVADEDDIAALVELMADFYAESDYVLDPEAAVASFSRLQADPGLGQVWLVEDDGQPAGYIVLTVGFSMEYGGLRGFVDDLYVRPVFRRRGLATAALAELRRECVRREVRAVDVEAGPDNEAALEVYRRAGFTDTGRLLLAAPLASPVHIT
jgi:ribosomal protein S18 acetylase RimI-like enzyme